MALTRTQLLYWGREAVTYGAPPVWADTDAHLATEIGFPQIAAVVQPRPVLMGNRLAPERGQIVGRKTATMSFRPELKGATGLAAAVPPDMYAVLEAAGFAGVWNAGASSWTFTRETNPLTATAPSMALRHVIMQNDGDVSYAEMAGCRTDISFEFVPGEIVRPAVTASGFWSYSSSEADVGVDYTADVAPPVVGDTAWAPFVAAPAFGAVGQIRRATLNLRNNVALIPGLHNTSGGGRYAILGYGPAEDPGSRLLLDVEADDTSLQAWLARWEQYTVGATGTSISVGSNAGNRIKFNFGRLTVAGTPQPIDLDGVYGFRVELQIQAATTAATTNNDLTIVYT